MKAEVLSLRTTRRSGIRNPPYNAAYFVLNENRQTLYARIDRRVDEMLENGLLDEVRALKTRGCTAKNGLHAGTRL